MSYSVQYTSRRGELDANFERAVYDYLESAGGEIESGAIQNTPRGDTGQLAGGWRHVVEMGNQEVTIGNSTEYAIWQERGTGEFAINGDGRKGAWKYQDANGDWHITTGNPPQRMLENAWDARIDYIRGPLMLEKLGRVGT